MMAFEIKMGELQRERDAAAELQARKDEAKRRAKERAARKRAEDNRLREAKRLATEEAEEAQRIAVTRAMFEKERELRAQRMRQEKVLRKKARAKEEERLRKQEEHRLQTQRIMQEQQNAIKRRMKEMELAEQVRPGASHLVVLRVRGGFTLLMGLVSIREGAGCFFVAFLTESVHAGAARVGREEAERRSAPEADEESADGGSDPKKHGPGREDGGEAQGALLAEEGPS